jgi:protein-L-isoaspartate(D-aspartate) O-methyltransferase
MESLEAVRSWYAEELRYVAAVKSTAVVRAFAAVPRERFLGPGPWQIGTGVAPNKYWETEDDDPRRVYHNVVIGMLPEKGLNNGQPSFWAYLFDRLDLAPGKRVVHLGCGAGYYSAVLGELVGPSGKVTGLDVEEALVARAQEALAPWPQVTARVADGATSALPPADIVVVSAGATHPLPQWLDALDRGGQLLLQMTGEHGWGQTLLATRKVDSGDFAAQFVGHVGIYHFTGARDAALAKRLDGAFRGGIASEVKSLRREAHAEDESCWLHCEGWCLSRREAAQ